MKKIICRSMALCMLSAGLPAFGYSNPIDGGTAEVVTNNYTVPLPWYMVGGNSTDNSLVVTDGGRVDNQIGYIGNSITASNNNATVTGAGSVWNSTAELSVGHNGSGNALTVSAAGQVNTAAGYVGNNSDNNTANIDGSGSLLNATMLHVGHLGSENQLNVTDAGRVESANASIGYWIGADNNRASVSNSTWSNSGALNVGNYGSGNQLSILGVSRVESPVVNLGVQTISSNNTISVSGTGSRLDAPELNIGGTATTAGGTGNRVEIGNGGTVATTDLTIHAGNTFDLNDGGTFAINNDFNVSMSGFNFNSGGTLEVVNGELTGMNSSIESQRTVVMNGFSATWDLAGQDLEVGMNTSGNAVIITNGGVVSADDVAIGRMGDDNAVLVAGNGSVLNASALDIGYRGSGNSMVISDGGQVWSRESRIGSNHSGGNNSVVVMGNGSEWNNDSDITVGNDGTGNALSIMDGAHVSGDDGIIGEKQNAVGNEALVSGQDSLWVNRGDLIVGEDGSGNRLIVSDGGRVDSDMGVIGYDHDANDNMAVVNGSRSVWNIDSDLYIGLRGSGNTLQISDGGRVYNDIGTVGGQYRASDNTVLVTGAGSIWQNREALYLGRNKGTSNSLTVQDGGWVLVGNVDAGKLPNIGTAGGLLVGDSLGNAELIAANESVIDTGFAFVGLSTNESGSATITGDSQMDVRDTLYVGYAGSGSTMNISDGATLNSESSFIGLDNTAAGNAMNVTGAIWNNNDDLYVGYVGFGNALNITDGGQVNNRYSTYIGRWSPAGSNRVTVSGSGSALSNGLNTYVGYEGSGNSMEISEGGQVVNYGGYIGYAEGADGNSVTVSGSGSEWSNRENVVVGYGGSGNSLKIMDGGRVENGYGFVGRLGGSSNNSVLVSGVGSEWNSPRLYVGDSGSGNSLAITDGGRVLSSYGHVGNNHGADNNSILVSGDGSIWDSTYVFIGDGGSGNSLVITNGGRVDSSRGSIGSDPGSDNNRGLVTGTGSVWDSRYVYVGKHGSSNALTIADGGRVEGSYGIVGDFSGADNNSVLVSGHGSFWDCSYVFFGDLGLCNSIFITYGGRVTAAFGAIGNYSDNNSAYVVGPGSVWNSHTFNVGDNGASNSLFISGGGRVESATGYVGHAKNSNKAVVSGNGSLWDNAGQLHVGFAGFNNQLSITNRGRVESESGYIGYWISASNNNVLVTGTESMWNNSSNLYVGYDGINNSMRIENGGMVSSSNSYIGHTLLGSQNSVLVSGDGSIWSNSGDLVVGEMGADNSLSVTNDGTVENLNGYIGYGALASGNSATVSGYYSTWDNSGKLHVGYNGSGNSLRIDDGAHTYSWGGASIGYGEMANSNKVVVSGRGSFWNTGAPYMLGRFRIITNFPPILPPIPGTGGGTIVIGGGNGGVISGGGQLIVGSAGTNNSVVVGGQGTYIGSGSNLTIGGGRFVGIPGNPGDPVYSPGAGYGGISLSNSVVVGGGGSVWQSSSNLLVGGVISSNTLVLNPGGFIAPSYQLIGLSYGELSVGRGGSFNTLEIEDGGLVASSSGIIGETSNAWFNSVSVTGTNSEWKVSNNLQLGGRMSNIYTWTTNGWQNDWVDGGRGNSLYVGDGGLVSVGRDMHNRNWSSISIDPGSQIIVASNYYQDATSSLRFGVETNAAGAPLNALVSVGGTAEFEKGARIEYASNVGQLHFDTFYTNKIIEADKLIVAGVEDADSLDLEMLDASGTLVDVLFWENEQDIYGMVGRVYLAESAGFSTSSMMGRLSKEIDDLSLLGDPNAGTMINLLNTMSGSHQNAQMSQLYSRGTASYLHGQSMTEGMGEIQKHTARFQASRPSTPEGAAGPYSESQELQIWVKPYGAWADYTPGDGFEDYSHNIYGTVVGFDKPLENMLVGMAGGFGRSVIRQDDSDTSEGRTGYGVLYANVGTKAWFSHASAAVGLGSVEQRSGTAFGNSADFDVGNFAAYLEGGRQVMVNRSLSVTPKASMLWSYYYQEGYTEDTTMGVAREVDSYDRNSFLASIGAAVAFQQEYDTLILKPEARLYLLHELNADTDTVNYQLVNGSGKYQFWMPAPEETVVETGLGLSGKFNDELELVLDVDWRFGQDYSAYAVSGRVAFEF